MLKLMLFASLLAASLAAPQPRSVATACDPTKCALPNCRCESTEIPNGLAPEKTPQFVFLTFDDAIQAGNYETYRSLFYDRKNPDGCPVETTYFMSHEYSDYTKVHDLYVHGHEIALHSITHEAQTEYWKTISISDLKDEFAGEKTLISHFANIPEDSIKGMRLPFLQLSGNNSYEVAKEIGLLYDCSWPTQTFRKPGLWPYTLDYKTQQDCSIGPCPTESIPGLWIVPMIDWTDQQNYVCSMVDACVNIPTEVEELTQWFIDNFNVQYNGNRAPFGFYVHNAYFQVDPNRLEAYGKFVDYLQSLKDVYLVSPTTAIKWIQNPVELGSGAWPTCSQNEDLGCDQQSCAVEKGEETRYMTVCGSCPSVYPWVGNPLGEDL